MQNYKKSLEQETDSTMNEFYNYLEEKIEEDNLKFKNSKFHSLFYETYKKMYNERLERKKKNLNNFKHNNMEIAHLIDDVKIDFSDIHFILSGIDTLYYSFPYSFYSDNIIDMIAISYKEFMSNKKNTIRQCQNCGQYFIPKNLKETKYCNNFYADTDKTCRQIGKDIKYKQFLKSDKLLDMYRKRYMSLASSVSHYGTNKSIERFEKYKKEGLIMKNKYLNKEISPEEFKNWITNTKQASFILS